MKYGIISMKHLQEDLEDWTWLYTAGRCVLSDQVSSFGDLTCSSDHYLTSVCLLFLTKYVRAS